MCPYRVSRSTLLGSKADKTAAWLGDQLRWRSLDDADAASARGIGRQCTDIVTAPAERLIHRRFHYSTSCNSYNVKLNLIIG